MTTEEGMVHSVIKDGADEGVWTKKLRAITGIQPTTLNKVLKTLESKGFIKQVKNVKVSTGGGSGRLMRLALTTLDWFAVGRRPLAKFTCLLT